MTAKKNRVDTLPYKCYNFYSPTADTGCSETEKSVSRRAEDGNKRAACAAICFIRS